MFQAKNWLSNSQALQGTLAERSLRMILEDLRTHITEHCLDEKQADMLMQKVDAISQMINRLLQLRAQSKVRRTTLIERIVFFSIETRVNRMKR